MPGFPLITVLQNIINIYVLVIIAWAILSWFNQGRGMVSDIYNALDKIVSPYVDIFRRFIPRAGGMDFSPFVAIIVLQVFRMLLVGLLV
jgi:YggT family protein